MGQAAAQRPVERGRRGHETILVVDDAEPVRTELCRILRAAGYTAIPARRGVEARWCLDRHGAGVDLLLVDLTPGAADDCDVGPVLDLLGPHTPVLFMSSAAQGESVRRGLLHPRAPFLRKPFPPYALTRTVRRVLDRWRTPPEA